MIGTIRAAVRRCRAMLGDRRTARRVVLVLWAAWAVIVWNVVFDHAIVVAGRDYVTAAGAAAKVPGDYARMDDWMRPAVTRGLSTATAAAALILAVGVLGARQAVPRDPNMEPRREPKAQSPEPKAQSREPI